jgi:hypothetical protein
MTLEERIAQIEHAVAKVGRLVLPVVAVIGKFVPAGVAAVIDEVEAIIAKIEGTISAHPCPPITGRTLAQLVAQNPDQQLRIFSNPPGNAIADYWRLLRLAAAAGESALILEDDILSARRFIAYVRTWQSPHMTSFFVAGGVRRTGRPEHPRDFGFSQALWFPWLVLDQLTRTEPPQKAVGWDHALAIVLGQLGESVVYHRSLVQHVGDVSLYRPGRTLEGLTAIDFVGEDFDCLSLRQ